MEGNKALLDANAVLRFLLRDNEEQFIYKILQGSDALKRIVE